MRPVQNALHVYSLTSVPFTPPPISNHLARYDCAAGCAAQGVDCMRFTYYPASGFCHMFTDCVAMVTADAKGALTYQSLSAPQDRPAVRKAL